jgi:hypothetical protein
MYGARWFRSRGGFSWHCVLRMQDGSMVAHLPLLLPCLGPIRPPTMQLTASSVGPWRDCQLEWLSTVSGWPLWDGRGSLAQRRVPRHIAGIGRHYAAAAASGASQAHRPTELLGKLEKPGSGSDKRSGMPAAVGLADAAGEQQTGYSFHLPLVHVNMFLVCTVRYLTNGFFP